LVLGLALGGTPLAAAGGGAAAHWLLGLDWLTGLLRRPYYENTQPLATSQEAASAGATQDKDV